MTVLGSGYNVVVRPCLAQSLQRMYICNDFDPMKVTDDGTNLRNAGITAPSSALAAPATVGGNVSVGTHLVRYRYEDTTRTRISSPSANTTVVVASASQLTFTNITSSDPLVNRITYEMTAAGGSDFYRVAFSTNTAGTTAINLSDASILGLTPSSAFGDFGHDAPPLKPLAISHRQRMFLWGGTTRTFTACATTSGLATITGGAGRFSTSWAGQRVRVGSDTTDYFIQSSTVNTITLTGNYSATNASVTITVSTATPDLALFSRAGYPESFDAINLARRITLASGDSPSAMASFFNDLYFIGQRSMTRFTYESDPTSGMLVGIPGSFGAFNTRCVGGDGAGFIFGWGRDGAWIVDAMAPRRISDDIDTTLASLADPSRLDERFVAYEPTRRILLFFFCLTGETSCRAAFAYELPSEEHQRKPVWGLWKFRTGQGMTASCLNSAFSDRTRLMLADVNRSSWRVGAAVNDGSDNGVISAGAACTTTVIQIGSGTAVVTGQILYRPATGEERLVSAGGASNFTLSSALATAPTVGETLYVGSIRWRVMSQWRQLPRINNKVRPRYLGIAIDKSSSMGNMTAAFYQDFSASPTQVTVGVADTPPTGISIVNGDTKQTINLDTAASDGYISVELPSSWARSIRYELIHETPVDNVGLLGAEFTDQAEIKSEGE